MDSEAKELMLQESKLPEILEQTRTTEGVSLEFCKEPKGILEVPGQENVVVGVHVGTPAKLTCLRDGKRYSGTAVHGDIDIIPPHMPMRWEMHDNETTLLLNLPQTLLSSVANESGVNETQVRISNRFQIRDTELEIICWAMKREMELGYPSGRFYLDGLAIAVASRVVARHSSAAKLTEESKQGLDGRRLKLVLSFIEDQLAENLSLEQIAAIAGISVSHLNALFRRSTGVPLYQYIIQRRVERAKTLLIEGGLSMAEIALAAGFAHQSHMARHMRRMLGVSPREMKRLLAENSTSR